MKKCVGELEGSKRQADLVPLLAFPLRLLSFPAADVIILPEDGEDFPAENPSANLEFSAFRYFLFFFVRSPSLPSPHFLSLSRRVLTLFLSLLFRFFRLVPSSKPSPPSSSPLSKSSPLDYPFNETTPPPTRPSLPPPLPRVQRTSLCLTSPRERTSLGSDRRTSRTKG